jgi:hypothetical protein
VWIANHDDFAVQAVIPISRHWGPDEAGDGDWMPDLEMAEEQSSEERWRPIPNFLMLRARKDR